jgi:hypothetical protein
MKENHRTLVSLLALAGLLCACNRPPGGQASGAPSAGDARAAASARSACDRQLIAVADLAGILDSPVVETKNIPGDPQSCVFNTGGFPAVVVSLRPTNGRITVETWSSGKMPISAVPLAGVGDHAAWVDSLHEVDAEKDDVLCVIGAPVPSDHYRGAPAELEQRLGALCNKIFAANAR